MTKSRAMDDESKSCNRLFNWLMFFSVALSSHALAMNNSPSPSQQKKIRSLGSYFFRNSTSRKPNSEVDLHFFFSFFLHFPQAIRVWEDCVTSKVCALDRRIRRRSCGWKQLWLLRLACAELGVFGVTGTILLVWWHRFSAAEKVGYPW